MVVPGDRLLGLRKTLADLEGAVVAFSGGADSTLLLRVCREVMGGGVVAVTADSPIHPAEELKHASKVAGSLGVEHIVLQTGELREPHFEANSPDRCYHCKRVLFQALREVAAGRGIPHVVEGSNLDDREDYRPGGRAADELGVRRPLLEAGLTKAEIREISRDMGLSTWDRPSLPCLASRIPYGTPITLPALAAIDAAETFIRGLGVSQVRVRHYGDMARIEVEAGDIERLAGEASRRLIAGHLRGLGYRHIALDLVGYRTGSLNEGVLP